MMSINFKICDVNDDQYTIFPFPVYVDEFFSTSVYGSDLDRSRALLVQLEHYSVINIVSNSGLIHWNGAEH